MKLILLILCSPAIAAAAQGATLQEAQALFDQGKYQQSFELTEKIVGKDRVENARKEFLAASAEARLQAFDKAVPHYGQAEALGSTEPSLHYDYGQALFASRDLKAAEAEFKKSIVTKFKVSASAYYVGYIRQLLEDYDGALDFYRRIQKLPTDPDKVKQPALYQIAEIEYDKASEEKNKTKRLRRLVKYALPLYKKAKNQDSGTPTAEQAQARITEIEQESGEGARMRNGNPIPFQPYTLRLSQAFTYDSNVITEADNVLLAVSNKDALISKTAVLGRYQFNWRNTFSFIPELNTSISLHSRRNTPRVYQNDNIDIAPAFRTKWEHWSKGKPATALFDLEYELMLRDYEQQHHFPFYLRNYNFVLGERVNWFSPGTTTFKLSIKFSENYNPDRNAYTPQVSLQQNVKLGDNNLQSTVYAEYMHARDDFNDERNYKLREAITFTKLFERVDVSPALYLQLKDTMKQKPTRGMELLLNPSLGFSRDFGPFEGNFEYAYSKNFSKSKDQYQYTKHEVKAELAYRF